jgi:triosephosphate isomerase
MNNLRKPMVAGNWKMNGTLALVSSFVKDLHCSESVDIVLCVPSPYLALAEKGSYILGAQDCSEFDSGAHTGDLAVNMLSEMGVTHVIVGHSERRQDHSESNILVANKVQALLKNGLTPILCVGEPLDIREAGTVNKFVFEQLNAVVTVCGESFLDKCVIAYEPIWAIGTGKTASPEQAQDVHEFIRSEIVKWNENAVSTRLLYGGSVNASNAKALFAKPDIDGGLIGGASLNIDDFIAICNAAK